MHIWHYGIHIHAHLRICHSKQRINTVSIRSCRTKGNQCVHIRRFMNQSFKSADKELLVDDHNNRSQKQLSQSHCHMIVRHKSWQWPVPHHMSHGQIHKWYKETQRSNQPPLQYWCISVFQKIIIVSGSTACLFICCTFQRCTISGIFHCFYNLNWRCCSFDSHGVRQKADRARCNTRHLWHSLLYSGTAGRTAHSCHCILFHH